MAAGRSARRTVPDTGAMADDPQPEFLEPPVRADGPVRLVEPDPTWPQRYAREDERIRTALGPRALQVEHVGSTAVPGWRPSR